MLLLSLGLLLPVALSEYVGSLEQVWNLNLPGPVRRGNQILDLDGTLFASAVEGDLYKVNPVRNTVETFSPDPLDGYDRQTSRAGIVEYGSLLLMTVISRDTTLVNPTMSRIVAVNPVDLTTIWSVSLTGEVSGDPVISESNKLYATHNSFDGFYLSGQVSAIDLETQEILQTLPRRQDLTLTPFGPPAVTTWDDEDVVIFAESTDDGQDAFGNLMVLVYDGKKYELKNRGVVGSAITAPRIVGSHVYLGRQGSQLVGWEGGAESAIFDDRNTGVGPWNIPLAQGPNPAARTYYFRNLSFLPWFFSPSRHARRVS